MDVFITWSGDASLRLANGLHSFLKRTIQSLRPFLSSEDIRMGQRWPEQIGARLSKSQFAIICLTKGNLQAPWIHFEAGAVAKEQHGRVSAILLDIEYSDVKWPLAQFHHASPTEEGIRALVASINDLLAEKLDNEVLKDSFSRFWPDMEKAIKAAKAISAEHRSVPSAATKPEDQLQELLVTSRENARQLAHIQEALLRPPAPTAGRNRLAALLQPSNLLDVVHYDKNPFQSIARKSSESDLDSDDASE